MAKLGLSGSKKGVPRRNRERSLERKQPSRIPSTGVLGTINLRKDHLGWGSVELLRRTLSKDWSGTQPGIGHGKHQI